MYVNGGVITECTHELNKTVPANAVFTDTTYSAGNGLNLSGTSFSAKAGTNVTVDASGINVNGNGTVASADSGLINGNTAYNELRPTLDGTWVKNAQTTAMNLQKLEGGIEYLYAILSKQYDQLKKYISGNYYDYDTDNNSKYVKNIPQGAMPYASLDSIGGKTVVWNQIAVDGDFTSTSNLYIGNGSVTLADNVLTYIPSSLKNNVYGNGFQSTINNLTDNHKYLMVCDVLVPIACQCNLYGGSYYYQNVPANTWTRMAGIITKTNSSTNYYLAIHFKLSADDGYTTSSEIKCKNWMTFDLTLMFGSGNEPTTVAEFQQMFPADYYAFNNGTLLSAGVTSVISKDADNTTLQTVSIPAEIQALEGYGWSAGSVFNYIDYEAKKFIQNVGSRAYASGDESDSTVITDMTTTYYPLNPAVETDISAYLTDDNLIEVESGGTLTFPNSNGTDYQIPVPSAETYMVDLQASLGG